MYDIIYLIIRLSKCLLQVHHINRRLKTFNSILVIYHIKLIITSRQLRVSRLTYNKSSVITDRVSAITPGSDELSRRNPHPSRRGQPNLLPYFTSPGPEDTLSNRGTNNASKHFPSDVFDNDNVFNWKKIL